MIKQADKQLIERLKAQVEQWRALKNDMTAEQKEEMIKNIVKLIQSFDADFK